MRDLPTGPALLALARDVLLHDLMALLPQEAHFQARLVANSMAIAEREAMVGDGQRKEIIRQLGIFYGDRPLAHPALRAGSPLSRNAGEGPEGGEGEQGLLHRFACDLRAGMFEKSEGRGRDAHDILWRLTIAKLRSANPRFLNANGFT